MPITLAWDPAEDSSVTGYAIYYGPADQPVNNRFDAGTNTTATLVGLRANVPYRFFAVSYDDLGQESIPSNEVWLTPPVLSSLRLSRQGDENMQLSAKAAPGTICTIQFTPTLQPPVWRTLRHATADQAGNIIAIDASSNQSPSRFYRLALGALPLLGRLHIQPQPDGSMLLTSHAPPGATCLVQYAATPDSDSWLTLKTVTADADGTVIILDPTAGQANQRFYRLVLAASPLLGPLQIHPQPDGSMLLTTHAPPGTACLVQYAATPNPDSWLTLKTVTADAGGKVTALDTTARQATQRFYRMALP